MDKLDHGKPVSDDDGDAMLEVFVYFARDNPCEQLCPAGHVALRGSVRPRPRFVLSVNAGVSGAPRCRNIDSYVWACNSQPGACLTRAFLRQMASGGRVLAMLSGIPKSPRRALRPQGLIMYFQVFPRRCYRTRLGTWRKPLQRRTVAGLLACACEAQDCKLARNRNSSLSSQSREHPRACHQHQ
eukprot:9504182-Pyramimonas_sp.AAC.4